MLLEFSQFQAVKFMVALKTYGDCETRNRVSGALRVPLCPEGDKKPSFYANWGKISQVHQETRFLVPAPENKAK